LAKEGICAWMYGSYEEGRTFRYPNDLGLLGGVTYISSSGVAAGVRADLGRMSYPETPVVVSILVIEDLPIAIFLLLVGVLLIGQGIAAAVSVLLALAAVAMFIAIRYGRTVSRLVPHRSEEATLFAVLGLVLLVAGVAQRLQVSAAIGSFLAGIAMSGPSSGRLVGSSGHCVISS
jgi:CPA2 family monovalent cation:H+ antiporter-2